MSRPHGIGTTVLVVALLLATTTLCGADFSQAVKQIDPAVVTITAGDKSGAGFIVSPDGCILTNNHVVENSDEADLKVKLQNDEELAATIAHTSTERDLCVLKLERTNLPVVQFASSDKLTSGQDVAAIGAPLGLEHSVTRGVVSALAREIEGRKYIQIDAALNEGNSGGPVINEDGQVIGVAVMIATEAQNVGFAIPSAAVMQFMQANGLSFNVTLGDAPAAEPATEDAQAETPAAEAEAGDLGPPASSPDTEAGPAALPKMPLSWLVWPAVISFAISLLTALIVSIIVSRRGPAPVAVAPAVPVQPGVPYSQPTPPPPPQEEDLSDIDIDLH